MRILPLLVLLVGCYDSATTTITLDVKAGTAHVLKQLHNAWPDTVGCEAPEAVEACVDSIREALEDARTELTDDGATVQTAGVVLVDGRLDLLFDYVAPVGTEALSDQGITILHLDDRTQAQVEKSKPGKKHVAMITLPLANGKIDTRVDGRYRLLSSRLGDEELAIHLFRGRIAEIVSEWTAPEDKPGPGAWVGQRPGLEEALRASGLVVEPPV